MSLKLLIVNLKKTNCCKGPRLQTTWEGMLFRMKSIPLQSDFEAK